MDNARTPCLHFPLFFLDILFLFLKYDLKISPSPPPPPPPRLLHNVAKMIYSEAGTWMVGFKAMAPRKSVKPSKSVKPARMLPKPSAHYTVVTSLMVIQFLKLKLSYD